MLVAADLSRHRGQKCSCRRRAQAGGQGEDVETEKENWDWCNGYILRESIRKETLVSPGILLRGMESV